MLRAKHIIAVLGVLMVILPGMVWGGDTEIERETLRGIKRVIFTLHVGLIPDLEKTGLIQRRIKTDIELKLRKVGLSILPPEEKKL